MKILAGLAYTAALGLTLGLLSGCSFQVGIDWNGKTAKDNRSFTATQTTSYQEASDKQKLRY